MNEVAGIDAIRKIREKTKEDYPVCLYVGDLDRAREKLKR